MVMESLVGQEEMFIRGIINKIFELVSERCIGLTEHVIKVNGWMEYKKVKEFYFYLVRVWKKDYSRQIN